MKPCTHTCLRGDGIICPDDECDRENGVLDGAYFCPNCRSYHEPPPDPSLMCDGETWRQM